MDPEKTKTRHAKATAKAKAAKKYSCNFCNYDFEASTALEAHKLTQSHKDKVNGVTKVVKTPDLKSWATNNKATKRYFCATCNKAFENSTHLDIHNATDAHLDKLHKRTYRCNPCNRNFDTKLGFDRHNRQPTHGAKVAALAEASS